MAKIWESKLQTRETNIDTIECTHCGIRFAPPPKSESPFCCKGCEFVHGLINREGLERFYDLKQDATGIPAGDRPFEPENFDWIDDELNPQQGEQETEPATATLTCSVRGVSCIGCVWLIEKVFLRVEGALRAAVDPGRGTATFTWDPKLLDIKGFAGRLARFGYTLRRTSEADASKGSADGSPGARLGICGALALNTMGFTLPRYLGMGDEFFLADLFELITVISATLCFLIGGTWFIGRAVRALQHRVLHIDLPIALGITVAYIASLAGWLLGAERLLYADFVATFTFLMLAGRQLHLLASNKFQNQAADESNLAGSVESTDSQRGTIPVDSLKKGDGFLVPAGGVLPVAGRLISPSGASFSLAWMTGEPEPASFRTPAIVGAGAKNLGPHPVHIEATEPWADSLVAKLTAAPTSGQDWSASPLLAKVLKFYLAAVLLVALLGGIGWLLAAGPIPALEVFIAILVISCPCAIGVALPLVDQRSAFAMQRIGVFVRNAEIWNKLRRVRRVIFDKTGTLTLERPELINTEELEDLRGADRAALASMVSSSLHPLSRSLAEELAGIGESVDPNPNTTEIPGVGLELELGGTKYSLTKAAELANSDSQPTCQFTKGTATLAVFRFDEEARPSAANALQWLGKMGMDTVILSGDSADRVRAIGRGFGLEDDSVLGGLSPSEKATLVEEMGADSCLYIGDGGNDSLAFDKALISGSPAARDALLQDRSDFVFTGRGLDFLPGLFRIAHWRSATVLMVLTLSVLYNLAAVALCLAGTMNPLLAAILMPLSSIATLLVAARRRPGGKSASRVEKKSPGRITPRPFPLPS